MSDKEQKKAIKKAAKIWAYSLVVQTEGCGGGNPELRKAAADWASDRLKSMGVNPFEVKTDEEALVLVGIEWKDDSDI